MHCAQGGTGTKTGGIAIEESLINTNHGFCVASISEKVTGRQVLTTRIEPRRCRVRNTPIERNAEAVVVRHVDLGHYQSRSTLKPKTSPERTSYSNMSPQRCTPLPA